MTTPTPEALAQAKTITSFLDAHTCQHSPGCLVCMLEERIALALVAYAAERERATWDAAATILGEEDFTTCPGAMRALARFRALGAAQGGTR